MDVNLPYGPTGVPGTAGVPYWQWPHPHCVPYGAPGMPLQGTGTTTWAPPPVTEDRIREIIREELARALENLK